MIDDKKDLEKLLEKEQGKRESIFCECSPSAIVALNSGKDSN